MMNGSGRRVGRPPRKKICVGNFGGGRCSSCYRIIDHGLCGCDRRKVGSAVVNDLEVARRQVISYVDQEVVMCMNEAGMSVSDDESVVSSVGNSVEEEQIDEGDSSDEEVEDSTEVEVMRGGLEEFVLENSERNELGRIQKCRNCCRKKSVLFEEEEPYVLEILLYEITGINKRLKFWTVKNNEIIGETEIALCSECASFLVLAEKQTMKNVWPVMMWCMITNEDIIDRVSVGVWSYVPMRWRHWWIDDFRSMYGGDEDISLCIPKPIFEEISAKRFELMKSLKELKLGDLMKSVNAHLYPTILCPWGCSEFPHKTETLPLDVVFFRYLGPGVPMVTRGSTVATMSRGSRDDYVDTTKEIHMLMNPVWRVAPSIAFDETRGPCVLVCRNHNHGTVLDYIHVPSHPATILPAKFADQLSPAVMQSRVIHPMRVKNYSISFQMHEMRGSFAGLDTLSLGSRQRFDFRSLISLETESVALRCRKDVRGLIVRLLESGKIPRMLVENMIDASKNLFSDEVLSRRRFCGATYMNYIDAIKLKKLRSGRKEITVYKVNEESGELTQQEIVFHPKWPPFLVHVHSYNKFGAKFPAIPSLTRLSGDLRTRDLRTVWYLISTLAMLPELWELAIHALSSDRQWMGWILSFVSDKCYGTKTCVPTKNNPFVAQRLDQVLERLGEHVDFCVANMVALFVQIPRVCVISENRYEMQNYEVSDGDKIIMVVRMRSSGEVGIQEQLYTGVDGKDEWQLRFVGATTDGTDRDPQKWKGELFARHGGPDLVGWWKQKRVWKTCCEVGGNFIESVNANWDILVYCQKYDSDMDKLRDGYLEHIGGQVKVYCCVHRTPMIPAVQLRGLSKQCSIVNENELRCTMKAYMCCAFDQCTAAVCIHHSRPDEEEGSCLYINAIEDENVADEEGIVSRIESEELTLRDGNHGSAGVIEDEVGGNFVNLNEEMFVTDNYVDDDEFMLGPQDGLGGSNGGSENGFHFETTNAGRSSYDILAGKGNVPGHVILNNCGSCLIRRNCQLKGTRYQQAFLQQIVSSSRGHAVPLVYPEGMLFPSIFWTDTENNSMVGALPAAVMASKNECRAFGFASMQDHIKARLTNLSLRCATDSRYVFYAYDCIANINLRGEDTRVILSRGFVESQGNGGLKANRSREFNTDAIDSRPVVHRLAAAVRENNFTYFYTQTVNQSGFFGIKPVKDWIDSKEYESLLFEGRGAMTYEEKNEIRKAGKESSCIPLLRQWMEVSEVFMTYIARSEEYPLGKVENIWWRHEYQTAKANLSHIHALIRLEASENQDDILDRIRGMVGDIIRPEEAIGFIEKGVLENVDEYLETREMARKVLPHFCSQRCLERIGPGENDLRCRAVYSRRDSSDATRHTMETIRVHHTPMAISIMAELGLCEECGDTGHFFPYDARLVSQRHHPPTSGGEGNISPTSPWLFAATKSQSNLQFCTSYSTARYVTKYAAGTDENNRVYIGVMTNTGDNGFSIRMDSQHLHNTKVTGSAINEKKVHEKRRDKHYPTGRGLAVTEAAAQLLGYPQVYTDLEFVDIATVPMEDRAGFDRDKPINKFKSTGRPPSGPNDVSTTDVIAAFKVRNETLRLPEWRKITRTQELMLKDLLFCPISVDKITVFGVRPPELAFVGHVGNYFRWFQREKAVPHGKAEDLHEEMIDYDVMKTAWVDGLNCRLRVRVRAIPEILKYIDEPGRRGRTQRGVCRLFLKLQECTIPENEQGLRHHSTEGLEIQTLRNMFFELGDTSKLPVPVFSNIKPTTPHRFLIHVLLSMGEFQNELELWEEGTIQRAFLKARLISNNDQEASVRALVKKYVMEQLLFMPGGTQMFDRLCIAAHSVLMSTLINDELPIDEMPSVLYTSLRQETEEKVERDIANKRLLLAKVSIAAVRPVTAIRNVPEAEELAVCSKQNPLSREIIFTRSERQGEESFQEQFACYNKCKLAIDTYATATPTFTKCRAITGGPGCGKTFVLNVLVLYAMSRGLSVTVTCLLAKRADFLGGIHVHSLFCIPVHESASVQRLAELAVISLYKNPEKLAFLQRLDVLAFDELGQISSELKSCIDMIMRRIRKSDQYMGGVLVLATIDPIQLRPIKGRPFLLSPFVLTCYRFSVLKHSVRAADDPLLQRIQNITRMLAHEYTPGIINELSELLERHCTFVESWSDASITPMMLRCFGKKAAIRQEGLRFMNEIGSSGRTVLYREADDFELSNLSHSQWQPATAPVIRALTKDVREPKVLPFYELAVYEMTYNKPGHFTHSQIAVLAEMPTNEMLRSFENVQVMLAPVGCKSVPPGVTCANELLTHGWRQVCVGLAPERVQSTKMGKKGKRQQYGLRHRVSSTIHAVMGSDLSHVVTKVSLTDPMYRLWEKEQVVVLLSRTVSAKDIIFVGRPRETIDAILQVIQIRSQYSEYMNHIINVLSDEGTSPRNLRDVPVLDQNQHPFCPLDVSQPNDCSGYCYILVSLKDSKSTYIGQTKKLVVRLKEHNSGYGSQGTSDPRLRPWALLAYVTGFDGNVSSMLAFERQWKVRRDNYQISAPMQIADMGRSLIASWQETNPDAVDLRYIATGTIGIITRLQEAGDVSL